MNYPDGTKIPDSLPKSYRLASTYESGDPRTIGKRCKNCQRYDNGYCWWWNAKVRDDYYCASWAKMEKTR